MATASALASAFLTSPVSNLSLKSYYQQQPTPPPPFCHHLLIQPLLPSVSISRRRGGGSSAGDVVSCLISGVDGGGVSDDFVSTRDSGFSREFAVLANMLKRIEPLDTSVIAKGVSDYAKDSMKQTISTMLGLLPSDQFSVTVRVSKQPLDRLIVSSIITGYTLWNAEYRISLMRNFDLQIDDSRRSECWEDDRVSDLKVGEAEGGGGESCVDGGAEDLESLKVEGLGDLSPEALNYIQQLGSELSSVKQELHSLKEENLQMEHAKKSNNDLLEYLRSLESEMVTELSRPSSSEVEEVIHQLAQSILQRFFKEDFTSGFGEDSSLEVTKSCDSADEFFDAIGTSRDYLAKLLFWCMLLGHHLRGLENRLHLSCVVGLL